MKRYSWTIGFGALTLAVSSLLPLSSAAGVQGTRATGAKASAVIALTRTSHVERATKRRYPVGVPSASSPSDMLPPGPTALPGYQLSYVNNFSGNTVPQGWEVFTGNPVGDPGGQWGASHVTVSDGVLDLSTWRDPAYGDEWVSGGVSQIGVAHTYGAYFVRSRLTGSGPTQVEMLWPAVGWPPEIDFTETYGNTDSSMATDHFTSANSQIHRTIDINMTAWHTWGVIWTPTKITYTVDGRVWGTVSGTGTVPNQPMSLHLQQQTWCNAGFACPTTSEQTLVDWVAEYTPTVDQTDTIGQFTSNSSVLTSGLQSEITQIADQIAADGDPTVTVTAYDSTAPNSSAALALARAQAVETYLQEQLAALDVAGIDVTAQGQSAFTSTETSTNPSAFDSVIVKIQ